MWRLFLCHRSAQLKMTWMMWLARKAWYECTPLNQTDHCRERRQAPGYWPWQYRFGDHWSWTSLEHWVCRCFWAISARTIYREVLTIPSESLNILRVMAILICEVNFWDFKVLTRAREKEDCQIISIFTTLLTCQTYWLDRSCLQEQVLAVLFASALVYEPSSNCSLQSSHRERWS